MHLRHPRLAIAALVIVAGTMAFTAVQAHADRGTTAPRYYTERGTENGLHQRGRELHEGDVVEQLRPRADGTCYSAGGGIIADPGSDGTGEITLGIDEQCRLVVESARRNAPTNDEHASEAGR